METMTSVCPFWISNWLHLLRNAWTRLFASQICVNPLMQTPGAFVTELPRCFKSLRHSLMRVHLERCEMHPHQISSHSSGHIICTMHTLKMIYS
jgi:hypothetical protein